MELGRYIGIPYGEARRLRYLSLACKLSVSLGEVDIHLLTKALKIEAEKINDRLKNHVRNNGVLRSLMVAHNYIAYCKWLGLIAQNGHLVSPNGWTAI